MAGAGEGLLPERTVGGLRGIASEDGRSGPAREPPRAGHRWTPPSRGAPEPVERLGQRGKNARGKTPRDGGARLEATPSEAGGGASETRAKFRKRRGGA